MGAGNFGREAAELVAEINKDKYQWNLIGYIDETKEKQGAIINNSLVLGDLDWLKNNTGLNLWAVCAVGSPRGKYSLLKKLTGCNLHFANLIHPTVGLSRSVELGVGNIVCWHSLLSVNTRVGNHVSINPGCGIGHDTVIDDYSSLYWNVTLAGNVRIHQGCEIGSKTVVIPQKTVGKWSIIGAGAVVTKNIPENCLSVGVPAQPLKNLAEYF